MIWRVLADETIELFAGTGAAGSSGDEGPAKQALLDGPESLAFGPDGTVFVFGEDERRIRRISPDGIIHAFAGSGEAMTYYNRYESGQLASQVPLHVNTRMAAGPDGELYVTLSYQHLVIRINPDGTTEPFAGKSTSIEDQGPATDGIPAVETYLANPVDVAVDGTGNIYIADDELDRIRRVRPDGVIENAATYQSLDLFGLSSIEVDVQGQLYYSQGQAILKVVDAPRPETYYSNFVVSPRNFSIGPSGDIYLAHGNRVVKGTPPGVDPVPVAGLGPASGFGEGGPATSARIGLVALTADSNGRIFLTDRLKIQVIEPDGTLRRYAGTGELGFSGDGGPALDATFGQIADIGIDGAGTLYVADNWSNRIRAIAPDGTVSTYAGTGLSSCADLSNSCGDGGPANQAPVPGPTRLQVGADGTIWFQDNNRGRFTNRQWVRRISSDGTIQTVDGVDPEGGPNLARARAIAVNAQDRLVVYALPYTQHNFFHYFDSPTEGYPADALTNFAPGPRDLASMAYAPNGALYIASIGALHVVSPDGSTVGLLATAENHPDRDLAPLTAEGFSVVTVAPDGALYVSSGAVIYRILQPEACPLPTRPEIALEGVRHGATFEGPVGPSYPTYVAPGQIVSIFGRRLGPEQLAGGQISGGFVTTETGGVRVLVGGQPAPMLYASAGQVAAIIPYGTPSEGAVPLQVEVDGVLSEPRQVQLSFARPGIFSLDSSGQGPGAILNQDGSLNTAANPARAGEVIVLWATGEGRTNPPGVDGLIANGALPMPTQSVTAKIGFVDAEVLYAGGAPGMVAGVMQVNLLVPEGLTGGAKLLELDVGESSFSSAVAQSVTVFVAP